MSEERGAPREVPLRVVLLRLLATALLLAWPLLSRAQGPRAAGGLYAARAIPRGTVLTADDIEVRGAASSSRLAPRSSLVGWTTRRVIAAGEPLRAPAVAPPAGAAVTAPASTSGSAVSAGQPVAVVYRDAGVELRLQGVAAQAGAVGARVGVRLDARRRLEGTVVAPGVVRVN